MNLTQATDYSRLAEMMGEGYVEDDARSFRAYLLSLNILNTDDVDDNLWPAYLSRWEQVWRQS